MPGLYHRGILAVKLFLFIDVSIDTFCVIKHHVVIHWAAASGKHLEDLCSAGSCDDGVGGGHGGDDVLDDALGEAVGNSLDAVLLRPLPSLLM